MQLQYSALVLRIRIRMFLGIPVPDPLIRRIDPDPAPDPSITQAKLPVRKTLIFTVLWLLYDFLSLKNDVTVALKGNKQINIEKQNFLVAILKVSDKNNRIR